ncbi:hypothetical protein V6Z79_004617 [Aspergillus fumigatus]
MAQATPFQKEAWTEYGIGVLIILGRIFARWKVVGVKNWQGDDYFAILALLFWTAELTMLELIGQHGANIGLTNAQRAAMTPDQVKSLVIGSKCLLAGWVCYVTLIWCLKACMLFFYNRLTLGLIQQKLVRINAVLCALSYVAVIFTIFFHCLPIQKHWQIYPDPGDHCTVDRINYIVLAVTNVCTDAVLVSIPVPLLAKVRLALRRKLVIGVLLCGGVFVMCAALLRCILSLRSINSINTSTIWAIRETVCAFSTPNQDVCPTNSSPPVRCTHRRQRPLHQTPLQLLRLARLLQRPLLQKRTSLRRKRQLLPLRLWQIQTRSPRVAHE